MVPNSEWYIGPTQENQDTSVIRTLGVARHGRLSNTTLYHWRVRVRVGLGFSNDETIGGQLTAGDHSRHYRHRYSHAPCM